MERRNFLKNTALTGAALATGLNANAHTTNKTEGKFNLKYAPHIGMFKKHGGDGPIGQLQFMAEEGFRAFEDNGMKNRDVSVQEEMTKTMERLNIEMGVFVAHKIYWNEANLASGNKDKRIEFLDDIRSSVEVAKRVNAKWMTVVPGTVDNRQDMGYQMINVIETLKVACEILEPNGLVMVLEPLNFRDHPNLFLTKAAQAYQICKAVDSPSCKILFDIYHQQITEGNIIPNIEKCWDEIAYFQVGDNPGRKEPGTGEINYRNVFKYIHEKGFDGIVGMEHGNFSSDKKGERAVINAYGDSDRF